MGRIESSVDGIGVIRLHPVPSMGGVHILRDLGNGGSEGGRGICLHGDCCLGVGGWEKRNTDPMEAT
jgi:hypothetical protein